MRTTTLGIHHKKLQKNNFASSISEFNSAAMVLPSVWKQVELAVWITRLAVVTCWKLDSTDDRNDKLVQCHVVKQFHLQTNRYYCRQRTSFIQQVTMFSFRRHGNQLQHVSFRKVKKISFHGLYSRTTRISRYQTDKTSISHSLSS